MGQTITLTASPLPVIKAQNGVPDWTELETLVGQWKPDAFLIGMPFNMDGTENEMTSRTKSFMKKMSKRFDIPCLTIDERLSTREAREISRANAERNKKKFNQHSIVDSIAAQLLLESWLRDFT